MPEMSCPSAPTGQTEMDYGFDEVRMPRPDAAYARLMLQTTQAGEVVREEELATLFRPQEPEVVVTLNRGVKRSGELAGKIEAEAVANGGSAQIVSDLGSGRIVGEGYVRRSDDIETAPEHTVSTLPAQAEPLRAMTIDDLYQGMVLPATPRILAELTASFDRKYEEERKEELRRDQARLAAEIAAIEARLAEHAPAAMADRTQLEPAKSEVQAQAQVVMIPVEAYQAIPAARALVEPQEQATAPATASRTGYSPKELSARIMELTAQLGSTEIAVAA